MRFVDAFLLTRFNCGWLVFWVLLQVTDGVS